MTNLDVLRTELDADRLPAILVSAIDNVHWATGFTGSSGSVLLTPRDGRFVTDSRYTIQAKEQVGELRVESHASGVDGITFLAQNAREMGMSRLGFEADSVSYATFLKLQRAFGDIELVPVDDLFGKLRMVKSATEIEKIRQACGLADACFEHVSRMIQVGVSEWDIGLDIEFFFRRQGAELAFEPIVVSGERSARPHGRASEKKLERGDFLTMDFGAKLDGYCSDLTRTVVVGEATDRHRELYGAVLTSQMAAFEAMKPGVEAKAVDRASRVAMGDYAEYFGHGLGHGLGSVVHDAGRMNASSTDVLDVNQVWTVEPGAYVPGFGGVRIEDDVLVVPGGIEVLTFSPKEMLVLG